MKSYQITEWCQESFKIYAKSGGIYIDATMGNGNDTLFLCRMAGRTGYVKAFDIQRQALEATEKLLQENGVSTEGTYENVSPRTSPASLVFP